MNKREMEKLIGKGENRKLEFKPSLSQSNEIIETISAFSNTNGGKILIGISDSAKIVGIKIGKDTIEKLTNKILGNSEPKIYPKISVEKIDDKTVIVIEVEEKKLTELNARQKGAMDYVKECGKISRREYCDINKVSVRTAFLDLKDMAKKGFLRETGKGRSVVYVFR